MKSQLTWQTVQNLERSFYQPTQTRRTCKTKLNSLWQMAIAHFVISNEPQVWQSQNEQGFTLWNAYDPKTGRSVSHISVSELRVWLEDRHYQTFLG